VVKTKIRYLALTALITLVASGSWAQSGSGSISLARGTFNFSYNTNIDSCGVDVYYEYDYYNYSYTDENGQTQPLSGPGLAYFDSSQSPCDIWGAAPPYSAVLNGTDSNGNGYQLLIDPQDAGQMDGTYQAQGIVYPQYQIQSIIYATPGNRSSNGYSTSTTHGTTTSVGNSFQQGSSVTFDVSGGFLGPGSTLSWTYGQSQTTSDSTSTSSTISQASGVANASGNTSNAINHYQDLFIISLNPAIQITQVGSSAGTYTVGTQLQPSGFPSPGYPEEQDQVEVFAQDMIGTGGVTTIPVNVLKEHVINGQTLPGLAAICANPVYYPNSCDQGNQCGCTPSDFTNILAADPLVNYGPTDNPLNADTSGPAACSTPGPSAQCRYVPVSVAPGSINQETELLAGPSCNGCNVPINTFMQSDANQNTQTMSESHSYTLGSSWKRGFKPLGIGFQLSSSTMWTWSDSESTGQINGSSNSMSVTFSSNTVDCNQQIPIFEDTVYHTFVFQQPPGDTTCP